MGRQSLMVSLVARQRNHAGNEAACFTGCYKRAQMRGAREIDRVQFEFARISAMKDSSLPPDCVKTLSEPFDGAQGERISTQFLMRPHRSW